MRLRALRQAQSLEFAETAECETGKLQRERTVAAGLCACRFEQFEMPF